MIYVLLALLLAAFGCGAEPGDELSLGSDSQAWEAYRTVQHGAMVPYYWGSLVSTTTSPFACTPAGSASQLCRFLQAPGNLQLATYVITYVSSGFTTVQRSSLESKLNYIVGQFNSEMAGHVSFTFTNQQGTPSDIKISAVNLSNANPPVPGPLFNVSRVAWTGCTGNLRETTSLVGNFQACTNSTLQIDLNDIEAMPVSATGDPTSRTFQALIHGILAAIGLGDVGTSVPTSWRKTTFNSTGLSLTNLLQTDDECMLRRYIPGQNVGLGDLGPAFEGGFPGC